MEILSNIIRLYFALNPALTNFVISRIQLCFQNHLWRIFCSHYWWDILHRKNSVSSIWTYLSFRLQRKEFIYPLSQGRNQKITMYYSFANNVFSVQIIPQQAIRLSKKYGIYITREFLLLFSGLLNCLVPGLMVRLFNVKGYVDIQN